MKAKIIEAAGKMWRILGEKKNVEISALPELVQEREEIVLQALGWLAREDKIAYSSCCGEERVALVPKEFEAYQRLHCKGGDQKKCCAKLTLRKLFDLKLF